MKAFESILRLGGAFAFLAVLACAPSGPSPSSAKTPPPPATADVAPATLEEEPAPTASSGAASTTGEGPLFDYRQDGHEVAFRPPNVVVFQRGGKAWRTCRTKLSDDANMWTGPDVERAFRDEGVASALQSERRYQVDGASAKLTAPGYPGSITWVSSCADCPAEPPGVKHFREVMQTVTANREAVCP